MHLENSNKNKHNFEDQWFDELRVEVARNINPDFGVLVEKYLKLVKSFNPIEMVTLMNSLIDEAKKQEISNELMNFLTCNASVEVDPVTCGQIADLIKDSKIGNEEKINLPTPYKFFKRASARNYTVLCLTDDEAKRRMEQAWQEMVNQHSA